MKKELHKLPLDGRSIDYIVRSSHLAKRTIIKITKQNLLEVVVPQQLPLSAGTEFLFSRLDWVKKNVHLLDASQRKYFYLGRQYTLKFSRSAERKTHLVRLEGETLVIISPERGKMKPFDLFMEFLRINGKRFLVERCTALAKEHDFHPAKISVRGQATRWGSCSRRGTLSINYKLMQLSHKAIDYVLIHELCHLRQMNHSKKFWAEVAKYVPDYKRLDKEINKFKN